MDNEKGKLLDEVEEHELEELQQDAFSTLRMKKLIATVIAEFKTANPNMPLTEEEIQHFNLYNNDQNNSPLQELDVIDHDKEFLGKGNIQLVGSNGDDLRKFIIHAFQQ